MTKPKPRILIQFRCTAKEKRAAQERAMARGMTLSAFVRYKLRLR